MILKNGCKNEVNSRYTVIKMIGDACQEVSHLTKVVDENAILGLTLDSQGSIRAIANPCRGY